MVKYLLYNIQCKEFINLMPYDSYILGDLLNKDTILMDISNDTYANFNSNDGVIVKLKGDYVNNYDINDENSLIDDFEKWFIQKQSGLFHLRGSKYEFTTPKAAYKMASLISNIEGIILDPCMGYGANLLVAAIKSGANPKKIYGIELNPISYYESINRLGTFGVPKENLHLGNCFDINCYDFANKSYKYPYDKASDEYLRNFLNSKIKIYQHHLRLIQSGKKFYEI